MGFEDCHPGINLFYFTAVLAGTIYFRHPVFLAISFCCAWAYSLQRNGKPALRFNLAVTALAALYGLWYASYRHFGVTVLAYNRQGNAITLEALACGLALGCVIAGVLMWLECVHSVLSSDKVIYLLGRICPRLSLFVAILLRLVPRVKTAWRRMEMAQQGLGRGVRQGDLFQRLRSHVRLASMTLTWLLESFVTTADSMRARGYTLPRRTAYSLYHFENRDRLTLVALFGLCAVTAVGILLGQSWFRFNPKIIWNKVSPMSGIFYLGYALLCLLPLILETASRWHFQYLQKKL